MDIISDDELIYMIRCENEEARQLLFLRYGMKSGKYVRNNNIILLDYGYDIDDFRIISNEVILQILPTYTFSSGAFHTYWNESYKNVLFNIYRKTVKKIKKYEEFEYNDSISFDKSDLHDSIEEMDKKIIIEQIRKDLENESQLTRNVLFMWMKGYSYVEIGNTLEISPKKVNNTITNIIKKLKNKYRNG